MKLDGMILLIYINSIMKTKLFLLTVMIAVAGCAHRINVPANTLRFRTEHGSLDVTHPQDTSMTNVVISIATNGTVTARIGSLNTRNSPEVIDKVAAGEVAKINALGTQLREGVKPGLKRLVALLVQPSSNHPAIFTLIRLKNSNTSTECSGRAQVVGILTSFLPWIGVRFQQ